MTADTLCLPSDSRLQPEYTVTAARVIALTVARGRATIRKEWADDDTSDIQYLDTSLRSLAEIGFEAAL